MTYYILQRTPTLIICDQRQTPVINVMNGDEALANRITTLLNNAEDIRILLDITENMDDANDVDLEHVRKHAQTIIAENTNGT